MTDLSHIAAREAAATPGPWRAVRDSDKLPCVDTPDGFWIAQTVCYAPGHGDDKDGFHVGNAAFIAHARTDIPFLLGEVSRLTAALATAEELNAAHRALAEAQSGHIETVNAAFERQYAQGFEAGKEAAAKEMCQHCRNGVPLDDKLYHRGGVMCKAGRLRIRALKKGDQ